MKKLILALGIGGTLFAGYLSSVKIFTKTCAFGEACPLFLGYPACYFGFFMYASIAILGGLLVWNKIKDERGWSYIAFVSAAGVLFAGWFTLLETPLLWTEGWSSFYFGLPTCALGLIVYVAIFVISIREVLSYKDDGTREGEDVEE